MRYYYFSQYVALDKVLRKVGKDKVMAYEYMKYAWCVFICVSSPRYSNFAFRNELEAFMLY